MTPELAGRLRRRGVWNTRRAVGRRLPGGFLALPRAGQVERALRREKGGRE